MVLRSGDPNHVKTLVSALHDVVEHERDLAPPIIKPQRIALVTMSMKVSLTYKEYYLYFFIYYHLV
jgi:hypothetical protein